MHIVHLDLERGWRGGQRQVALLIRELSAHGVSQTLVCRRGAPYVERLSSTSLLQIVEVANRFAAFFQMPRADSTTDGGDETLVFHAHTGNTVPLAVLGAGRRHRSVITRRLDLPVRPWFFRRADRVVGISGRVAQVLREAGVSERRVRQIPSAIDRSRSLNDDESRRLREELGISADRFIGLTVAALVDQKDPLTLVRALRRLPEAYLHVWVGSGELEPAVRKLSEQLEVSERLLVAGFDPEPDRWFGIADAFVLPSVHEGLGTVALDAFHFGVPVVASDIPGTADLLEDGRTALLFRPRDSGALAAAVNRLEDHELVAKLQQGGERRVAGYDIRDTAKAYLELYKGLVD